MDAIRRSNAVRRDGTDHFVCAQEVQARYNKMHLPDDLITSSQMQALTGPAAVLENQPLTIQELITSCEMHIPTRASEVPSFGMDGGTQLITSLGNQVRSFYGLITSLRTQVIAL
uniref:AlNc14C347G10866 protein n=1 Tax=Albugo laibachii Nc14 TaxID=890382 RepID=F0WXB4_9STRA|nr:AlNc14C347G10866 [Albugo laibachii Nc14]|eukprot:CCA26106.1 AlNc14C347G10866 [Albugo laibachii Nc14]